jgi:hypothetical protein
MALRRRVPESGSSSAGEEDRRLVELRRPSEQVSEAIGHAGRVELSTRVKESRRQISHAVGKLVP